MRATHAVKLPHPDRQEPTTGTCTCGWVVVYGWGDHWDATDAASDHIRDAALAEPYVTEQMNGTRYVNAGCSL